MPRIRFYLIGLVALAALLMVGCAGGGTSGKRVSQASDSLNTEERMPSDTLYTEERAMAIFDSLPERALQILDSAEAVGNLPDYRAGLFRAKVLSSSTAMQQQDSAIIICEALLRHDEAHRNVDFRQDVLELLVNASRMRDDYEEMIRWGTELAGLLREQNLDTEALRTLNLVSTDGRHFKVVHLQNDKTMYNVSLSSMWALPDALQRSLFVTVDNVMTVLPPIPGLQ